MTTKSFDYELRARYEGATAIQKMRSDIQALGKVKAMQELASQGVSLGRELNAAKDNLKTLAAEMKSAGSGAAKQLQSDYESAQKSVAALAARLTKNKQAYKDAAAEARTLGVDTKKLVSEKKRLTQTVEVEQSALSAYRALGVRSHQDIRSEIIRLASAYKALANTGKATTVELAAAKERLKKKVGELRREMHGTPDELKRWVVGFEDVDNAVASMLVTFGQLAVAWQSITVYANFDDVMRTIKALRNLTDEETAKLADYAKELGNTTSYTSTEVAEAMQELAQSGMGVKEIFASLPGVLNMATVAKISVAEAADYATNIVTQFGLKIEDTTKVVDLLTKGFTSTSATSAEFANALSYVGPVARSVGYSLEETLAILEVMAEAGYKGERAGTALRGGLTGLLSPTRETIGIFEKYAITINDSNGKMRKFSDIIEQMGSVSMTTGDKLAIFGMEAGPAMSAVIDQGVGKLKEFEAGLKDVDGIAEKIATDKAAGIGGSIGNLTSALQGGALRIGETWAPAVQSAVDATTDLILVLNKAPDEVIFLGSALGAAYIGVTAWNLGLKQLHAQLVLSIPSVKALTVAVNGYVASQAAAVGVTTLALYASIAGLAAAGVAAYWGLNKLIDAYGDMKDAEMKASNSAAELAKKKFALSQKLRAVAKDTGLVYNNIIELNKAITAGTVVWDEAAKKWVKGSGMIKEGTKTAYQEMPALSKDAIDAMRTQWEEHVARVNDLQEQIIDREKKLDQELRVLARKSMPDSEVWSDRKREAEEYAKAAREAFADAQKALKAGDQDAADKGFAQAVQYADQAKDAYKQLSDSVEETFDLNADAAKESASTQEKVTREAIEAVKKKYEEYADKVASLQDEIAGREKSLAEELRDIARSGMGEYDAWRDRKAEAEEYANQAEEAYQAAKRALTAGQGEQAESYFKEAVEYADAARAAYADLNEEVSEGDTVYVSQQRAAEIAAQGVKETGELAIEALRGQEEVAQQLAKTASSTYSNLAQQYNSEQEAALSAAMKGMEDAGKLAVDILRQQQKAAEEVADALDARAGLLFSQESLAAAKQGLEDVSADVAALGDRWEATWKDAESYFNSVAGDIESELDRITRDREVTITAKVVEEKQSGGLVGYAAMAAGGSVASRFATAVGYRNMLGGGHLPGYGGGDRRWILGEDGEVMLRKESVSEAGLPAALAFNAKNWPLVIRELSKLVGDQYRLGIPEVVKARTGGMISRFGAIVDNIPRIPVQVMQAGGPVVAGAGGGGESGNVINLQIFRDERPVQVIADRTNADEIVRQINRKNKYRSS